MRSWLFYLGWVATGLPFLAGVFGRSYLIRARRAVIVWSLLLFGLNGVALWMASTSRNTHLMTHLSIPLECGAALAAVALWQLRPRTRRIVGWLLPFYIAAWIAIVFLLEDVHTFSVAAGPFSSLVVLTAASATLIVRVNATVEPLLRQDWFWVLLGFVVFYGVETGLPPLSLALWRDRPDLLLVAYQLRVVSMVVAMVAVTRGVLCPKTSLQSGGPSSRLASPSLSLLSRSG
jgi:hypothetical protein